MKEELKQEMLTRAVDGKLSCAAARKLAEDLRVSYQEIGDVANELAIRIQDCQLGCF